MLVVSDDDLLKNPGIIIPLTIKIDQYKAFLLKQLTAIVEADDGSDVDKKTAKHILTKDTLEVSFIVQFRMRFQLLLQLQESVNQENLKGLYGKTR